MAIDEKELAELIAKLKVPVKNVPFEFFIKELYGVSVVEFDATDEANKRIFDTIRFALMQTCDDVKANPINRSRPNDVGNEMESRVIDALDGVGLKAAKPKTTSGSGKDPGYPDIRIEQPDGLPIYLEVKTYAPEKENSVPRSFYFSPSDDPKVTETAYHLLAGFVVEKENNLYRPVAFKIMDLFGLQCDLKAEFNSNNRRLYEDGRILASEHVPMKP